jgi:hypothetical protein
LSNPLCLPMECVPGKFGATTAMAVSSCTGDCTAGYFCGLGSTSATQSTCPAGQFSGTGASACSPCSLGRFGSVGVQTTSSCVGPCAAGRYGDTTGQTTSNCVGACTAGRFGATPGQTTSSCEGACQVSGVPPAAAAAASLLPSRCPEGWCVLWRVPRLATFAQRGPPLPLQTSAPWGSTAPPLPLRASLAPRAPSARPRDSPPTRALALGKGRNGVWA